MNHADSGAVDWAFVAAVLDQAEKGEVVLDSEIARICRALLAALDDLDAVKAELERDRSQVIDTVNALHSEIAGRQWMLEGRGPYEWDDDRYRDEFAAALGVIKAPIEVLRKIGADWSNCPTDPAAIKAARVNDRARAEAAEAANAALTARVAEADGLGCLAYQQAAEAVEAALINNPRHDAARRIAVGTIKLLASGRADLAAKG